MIYDLIKSRLLDKICYLKRLTRRFIIRSMSEDRTRDLSDNRSFEDRVFARFDAMDARFDGFDTRVQALEARAIDTKPIWERALTEILEVKQSVAEVKQSVAEVRERVESIERKFDLLTLDMMQLRGDQRRLNSLFDRLESKPA
jgi:chromosome segregation ATPase